MNIRTIAFALTLVSSPLLGCDELAKETTCASDEQSCNGACTTLATDIANCGACGVRCGSGRVCAAGVCRCGPGTESCGTACADLSSDPNHCGACNQAACAAPTVCTSSNGATRCADACASGQTACDRACVDLETNRYHCGACGRICGSGESCRAGNCTADLYLACFNVHEIREANADLELGGAPLATDNGPVRLAWLDQILYVANSSANTVSRVLFDPPGVRSMHGASSFKILSNGGWIDLEYLATYQGMLYVSNASFGTLVVLRPDGTLADEIPLAEHSTDAPSPQGIAFVPGSGGAPDKAYVALNGTNQVAVIPLADEAACAAPPCTLPAKWIDLQPLASPGGQAQPSRLLLRGSRLYVTLWNYDTSGTLWKPAGSGRLAVIDLDSDALDASIQTASQAGLVDLGPGCLDPAEMTLLGDTLYVTCGVFDYSTTPTSIHGSSIVPVDLSGQVPQVGSPAPAADGTAPGKLTFCDGQGYVGDRNSGLVYRFDPGAGKMSGGASLCPTANGVAWVSDILCGH
jgi:hypothetical protein